MCDKDIMFVMLMIDVECLESKPPVYSVFLMENPADEPSFSKVSPRAYYPDSTIWNVLYILKPFHPHVYREMKKKKKQGTSETNEDEELPEEKQILPEPQSQRSKKQQQKQQQDSQNQQQQPKRGQKVGEILNSDLFYQTICTMLSYELCKVLRNSLECKNACLHI